MSTPFRGGSGLPELEELGERKHGRDQDPVPAREVAGIPQELAPNVARFGHGSRVPGWDEAADLEKAPQEIPDAATTPVPAELRAEIEAHMAKYPDRRSAALPCLAAAQRHHGWCSPDAIRQVAAVMRLTPGYLISVASFYDMFDTRGTGHHRVYVCTNISCSLNGGRELYKRMKAQMGDDPAIEVRGFECLGACDIAPMASIDGTYVGPIDLDEVPELAEQIRSGQSPLPAKQLARRRSVDPNAASATPGPPFAAGPSMEGVGDGPTGPTAPLEQAPDPPEGPQPKS